MILVMNDNPYSIYFGEYFKINDYSFSGQFLDMRPFHIKYYDLPYAIYVGY